uniref:Transcription factor bHLH117 family n=2 Tax=Cajanus cajan TaxID=3821 RepID=A0A151RP60_CAJCA|nr:Transcription factor bHLH117 family [Cajanus cajan]
MPWDKKMDQATLLEEAYKYVKFLQAQLRVLHSMPSTSASNNTPFLLQNGGVFQSLNRTQLLQVLVNSPVAQTMLYSQGFCVFSLEQLSLLRKLSERRLALAASASKTLFNSHSLS